MTKQQLIEKIEQGIAKTEQQIERLEVALDKAISSGEAPEYVIALIQFRLLAATARLAKLQAALDELLLTEPING